MCRLQCFRFDGGGGGGELDEEREEEVVVVLVVVVEEENTRTAALKPPMQREWTPTLHEQLGAISARLELGHSRAKSALTRSLA